MQALLLTLRRPWVGKTQLVLTIILKALLERLPMHGLKINPELLPVGKWQYCAIMTASLGNIRRQC